MKIKEAREAKLLTQEELANILGVDASSVSKWETAKIIPRVDTLKKLCKVLEIKVEEIIN
jgi:transcriptional regulator with XRE-family HTH domain